MRLFEKHRNGSVIDIDGEPDRVIKYAVEWRQYNDAMSGPKTPVGFVPGPVPPKPENTELEEVAGL